MMQYKKVETTFRMLSKLDFQEFKSAAMESVDSNMEYLYFGKFFDRANLVEMMNEFTNMLEDQETDHYGIFAGRKLLGHIAVTHGQGPLGVELYGWVRQGFHNKGIGELGLQTALRLVFEHKGFNYAMLQIDQENGPSKAVAEKLGFIPAYKEKFSESALAKTFIVYYKTSPLIMDLAKRYKRKAWDLMNCPATSFGYMHYLLKSDSLIDFYQWPLPPFEDQEGMNLQIPFMEYMAFINMTPDDLEYIMVRKEEEAAGLASNLESKIINTH